MDAETAMQKIKAKVAEIDSLSGRGRLCPEFKKWHRETTILLQRILGRDAY